MHTGGYAILHPSNHIDIATVEAFQLDDFDPAAVTNVLAGKFSLVQTPLTLAYRCLHVLVVVFLLPTEANRKAASAAPDSAEAATAQIEVEAATNLARALGVSA